MARSFGRDEHDVDARGSFDLSEMDIEAVRAHEDVAGDEIRANRLPVDVALHFVGQQNVNDVGLLGSLFDRQRIEAVAFGQVVVGTTGSLADDDGATAVAQVLGVGVSL